MARSKKTEEVEKHLNNKKQSKPEPTKKLGPKSDLDHGETHTRYRIQLDIGYRKPKGKVMDDKTETVPDMNLTVRQLLENHTRGRNSEVHVSEPLYFEEEIPQIYDMTDIDRRRESLQKQLSDIDAYIAQEKAEREAQNSLDEQIDNRPEGDVEENGQTRIPD